MYTTSEKGYAVVRAFEGLSLKAYRDEVGVWTIGFGNTNYDASVLGFTIKAGVTITREQAYQLLRVACQRRYEPAVNKAMGPGFGPAAHAQAAFDAGLSFHYNTGAIGRASWVQSFAAAKTAALRPQLLQWNKAGGKVLAGLTRRRNREDAMIERGDYGPEGAQTIVVDEKGRPVKGGAAAPDKAPALSAPAPHQAAALYPWHERLESILGLYEFPGDKDNPCILAMAQQCGGSVASYYKHDAIAWCALTISWVMITTGYLPRGGGSLAAGDFRNLMVRLDGPCVGAVAVKSRTGGNHVFLVRGRTADGKIVGTGGNQADMVCDEVFDPAVCWFGLPRGVAAPKTLGVKTLPIVTPRPHAHRTFSALPGNQDHPATAGHSVPDELKGTSGMLQRGDRSPEVGDVQERLGLVRTETFDAKTEAAVRSFQKAHPQLENTGIVDPATKVALKRKDAGSDKLTQAATRGGAATGGTEVADHATGGHLPWEIVAGVGLIALCVVGYIAWQYRDEIKAMLLSKFK